LPATACWRTLELVESAGAESPSYLNVAITDGESAVASRFTDADDGVPESLYYFTGELYPAVGGNRRPDTRAALHAVTVSSERLTNDPGWTEVPAGQIIILRRDRAPEFVDARTGEPSPPPPGARTA
jgi:predicted glutamine amidotransferase